MWTLIFIFFAELTWSYCASQVTVELVRRHLRKALVYDSLSLFIAYEILAVLSRGDWDQVQILAAVLGGVVGTGLVAGRRKKKRAIKNLDPVNI